MPVQPLARIALIVATTALVVAVVGLCT